MATWTSSNGDTNTLNYDTDARLSSIGVPGVQSLVYGYDSADRATSIANAIDGTMTETLGYDAMSRLLLVTSIADNESFQYDANGNRTTQTANGTTQTANGTTRTDKSSPTSNQLTSVSGTTAAQYGYDAQGNLTTISSVPSFHYDAFNRMDSAGTTSYYVGPEGQRLRKQSSAGTTYFAPDVGNSLAAETSGSGWSDYIWLNGRLIGEISNGQIYAIHVDQVGRPEAMTNASGAIVWRAQNFPFTRVVTVSTGPALNLGFPGQYYEVESDNWNNGFRDYSPALGRYLEGDPTGLNGGVNTYAYVGGNPLGATDPLGLATLVIYSGATNGNPFGHISIATTDSGLFSYGTVDSPGSSVKSFVDTQLLQRNVSIAVIPYTSSADEAFMDFVMQAYMKQKYNIANHNCSTAVGNALNAGGIPVDPTSAPGGMFNQISNLPGAQVFNLSPGSTPPDLSSFNRH